MSVFSRFQPAERAYFAKMRENGVQRLAENPLVEAWQMRDDVWSFLSKSPGMGGDAWMHLIVGPERALLVDTGFGIGDMKALAERITGKPVIVVNTHCHGDHVLGNFQFDAVYCHEYDADSIRAQMKPEGLARIAAKTDDYYKAEDVVAFKEYEVVGVEHGHIFDLGGGHEVELFHLPGHSPGGCGFIDKKNRILFSGDAIVSSPGLICGAVRDAAHAKYCTIRAYRDRLAELVGRMDEFDVLYPGHNFLEFSNKAVTDALEMCEQILRDPDCQDDVDEVWPGGAPAKLKIVGLVSVAYTDDRIG